MPTLWFDLDEIDDEDEEEFKPLPEEENVDELDLPNDEEDIDIVCPLCGSFIEDGVQCEICGYLVEIYTPKKQKGEK